MASCNKIQHDVAACSSMLHPDKCCLFEHVAAGNVAACLSMMQPDMQPPARTCYRWIRTCCSRDCIFRSLIVQTSPCAVQSPIDQRHLPVQQRPLQCRHVHGRFRSLQCRKVQEQLSRYVRVQLKPLQRVDNQTCTSRHRSMYCKPQTGPGEAQAPV